VWGWTVKPEAKIKLCGIEDICPECIAMLNATALGIGQQKKRSRGSRGSGREESRRENRTGGRGNIAEIVKENERTQKRSIQGTIDNRQPLVIS
jgi:hypothetical protein